MKKNKEDNIVKFPSSLSSGEREVEAILFAAAEPLEIESIEVKVSKNINVKKTLEKYEIFDCKKLFFLPDAIIRIDELRNLIQSENKEKYDDKKRHLPAVTISGNFKK